jgi:hypothetical protein
MGQIHEQMAIYRGIVCQLTREGWDSSEALVSEGCLIIHVGIDYKDLIFTREYSYQSFSQMKGNLSILLS